jgi:hypothetical protein
VTCHIWCLPPTLCLAPTLSLPLTPSVARNASGGFSPLSAWHQPPPSLETRAEGSPLSLPGTNHLRHSKRERRVLPSLCLAPTPSIARNASGGVFPLSLPATLSLPGTNPLHRSKHEQRGFSPLSAFHHPPSLPATNPLSLPATNPLRRSKCERRVSHLSLPATNSLHHSEHEQRGLPPLSTCHPLSPYHQSPPSLEMRAEGFSPSLCFPPTPSFCLPPTPSVARNASRGVHTMTLVISIYVY